MRVHCVDGCSLMNSFTAPVAYNRGVDRVGKVQDAGAPSSRHLKNNFTVTVKSRTSGYQTLESYSLIICYVAIRCVELSEHKLKYWIIV